MQNNLDNLQGHISQQFKTLVNNMDSQQDVMTQLKETVQKVKMLPIVLFILRWDLIVNVSDEWGV